ncbi:hypothetical protein Tco_0615296 [Tanacetum coccineum]
MGNLALYDNESWNDPRDLAKPVKAITLPQDVPSTSDRRLIELENQVQRLMEAHLAPTQPTQVNKITTSCEICSGPHDTQYCMEDPEQAFVKYASSRTDETGGFMQLSVQELTYGIKCRKFFIKNKNFIFTERGDGVTIYTRRIHHDTCDGVTITLTASYAQVIFDGRILEDLMMLL